MTAYLLTGFIGLMIGMGFAFLTNDSWYRDCAEMNENWAKLCMRINEEWYERCKSLIDGENETCEKKAVAERKEE